MASKKEDELEFTPLPGNPWATGGALAPAAPAAQPDNLDVTPLPSNPWAPKQEPKTENPGFLANLAAARDAAARQVGLNARAGMQGGVGGILGLPAMAADAATGVGRDIAYWGHRGLAAVGAADAPDDNKYYGKGSAWPMSELAAKAARVVPDALNLPEPENPLERIGSAAYEGATGAMTGAGMLGLAAKAGPAGSGLLRSLAAEPGMQALSGGAGAATATAAKEAGANDYISAGLGFGAGVLAPAVARGARSFIATPNAQTRAEQAAGQFLRESATDPELAIKNLETVPGTVRNPDWRMYGTDAARDPGLASRKLPQIMREFSGDANAVPSNNARVVSGTLDRLGAGPGKVEQAAGWADDTWRQRIDPLFKGENRIDTTGVTTRAARGAKGRLGTSSESWGGHEIAHEALTDARRQVRETRIPVEGTNLAEVRMSMPDNYLAGTRKDLSDTLWKNTKSNREVLAGGTSNPGPMSADRTKAIGQTISSIDDLLNTASDGRYTPAMNRYRAAARARDVRRYYRALGDETSKGMGTAFDEAGARIPSDPRFNAFMRKTDSPNVGLKTGPQGMTWGRAQTAAPRRAAEIENLRHDIRASDYTTRPGVGSSGPGTAEKLTIPDQIAALAGQARSPRQRLVQGLADTAGMLGNSTGRLGFLAGGPAIGAVGQAAGNATKKVLGNIGGKAVETISGDISRLLGSAELNPAEMARLMRSAPLPTEAPGSLLARYGRNTAVGGLQGLTAGERTNETGKRRKKKKRSE